VAIHNRRLELVDLDHVTSKPLGDGLFMAAWSPDGKWLAALLETAGKHETVLMDASSLKRVRVLGDSDLEWSPDSRYLLGVDDHCGAYYGTLVMMDIETGSRTSIESSRCKINQDTIGWVSSDVRQ